jgi:hypothetical protein
MWRNAWARLTLCVIAAITAGAILTSTAAATVGCNDTWNGSASGDWDVGSNWSSGVPVAGSEVCIESGSAVITDTDVASVTVASLDIGGNSGGAAGLTVSIHDVVTSASTTIGASATLTLNGTYSGANAGNAALGGGPVDNHGTIVMEGSGYGATLYGAVLNQGTINVPDGNVAFCQGGNGGNGSLENQGTINISPASADPSNPAIVDALSCPVTDDGGGSIVNNGSFYVYGPNGAAASYIQGNGTTAGNAIKTGQDTTLEYTGTGASSVEVPNSLSMTGNLAAGQQLTVDIGTIVTEAGSFTNAGSILLNGTYYGSGGGPAGLTASSGTFTNTGTLTAESGTALNGTVVNDGTVAVEPNSLLELESGSFTNAASGTFAPEISSTQIGYLQSDVGTAFTAGGTLAPVLEGGFTPATGQEFDTLTTRGGSYSGTFAAVAGNWHADYSTNGYIGSVYGAGASTPAPTTPAPSTPAPATPAPTPAASPAAPAVSSLAGGAGLVEAKLRCAASAKSCRSYLVVASVTEHLQGKKLLAITALKKKTKTTTRRVTVASSKGSLKPGRSVTLKLTLNPAGQALLKRYGKLKVSVVISAGGKVLKRETVTVTRPKPTQRK